MTAPHTGDDRPTTQPGCSALEQVTPSYADHRVTLAQIGRWRLLRLAARDVVHDDPRGQLWMRVGPNYPHRKILIVLRGDDTYAVEVGRIDIIDHLATWVSEAAVGVDQGVYGGELGETVEGLYEQVNL